MKIVAKKIAVLLCGSVLFACSAKDAAYNYPDNPDYVRNARAGQLFGSKNVVIWGKAENKVSTSANALEKSDLWQAAVATVEATSAISLIDPDGGLIVTNWQQDSSISRSKIHIVIKRAEIKIENLQIFLLHQKKNASEAWENLPHEDSDKNNIAAVKIREKILSVANGFARARSKL